MCSGLALAFFDYAVIYGSCISGSYLLVRGVSLIFGGFPNEFMIYDSIMNSKLSEQQSILFLYILTIILASVFGIQRQLKLRQENLDLYSYKQFDFSFRRPVSRDAVPGTGNPNVSMQQPVNYSFSQRSKFRMLAEDEPDNMGDKE